MANATVTSMLEFKMHKISELLPNDIIRYIYEILSIMLIQSVFRKNRYLVKRDSIIGSRVLVLFNDYFKYGTIDKIDCDILIQLLPTSPFITTAEIVKNI